ncbi:MAG: Transcription factor spt20 [Candelina submexicana]|nr:MAG: Transcription factor spt20 [Candelina submexicana]
MATATATKSPQPHQKIKRPPPPSIQTTMNGANSSNASPSPSLGTKRPPSGFKHPPTSASATGSSLNGVGSRVSSRQRRESQRPGESSGRPSRTGGNGQSVDMTEAEKLKFLTKRPSEPYVPSTAHILSKFEGVEPSLIIHLHPTHFRFDQQDGSFGYNSPMRVILEHIRSQTVPHDMLEELLAHKVKFYDGCLIIQIHDHKSVSTSTQNSSSIINGEKNAPFSIHNYNEHLTPSPYAPYPQAHKSAGAKDRPEGGQTKDTNKGKGLEAQQDTDHAEKEKDKENMAAPGQSIEAQARPASNKPKVFTTVLHSTPLSLQAEMTIYASTPEHRSNGRKQSQAYGAAGSSSATMPHPPTPSTAGPSNAQSHGGHTAKRQKMMLEEKDYHEFEAQALRATTSPLYLHPANDSREAQELLNAMKHPLHQEKPPAPKTRKRTTAELAADEALAAQEERFMLIMDERLGPTTSGAAAVGKAASTDGQGGASFEPRFSRFKTLENIKMQHEDREKRRKEEEMRANLEKKQQQEANDRQNKEEMVRQEQLRELQARQQAARLAHQHQMQQMQQQQQAQQQQLAAHGQHTQPNGIVTHPQQHLQQGTQGPHSSPVVRQHTPHNSSPLVGNLMTSHPATSVPMNVTSSSQGAGSPPRPPSVAQHRHPGITSAMTHQMTQQRSQQGPSRNGTPQMPNSTPNMQQATPVTRNVTPTQRLNQGSPAPGTIAHTPVMNQHGVMATPQMNGAHLTPQQQQQLYIQRQQIQQQQQQQQLHGSPPQLTPQQIQQFQVRQHAQQQLQLQQQQQQSMTQSQLSQQQYQAQLNQQMQQQMAASAQGQHSGGGAMPLQSNNLRQLQQQQHHQQQQQLLQIKSAILQREMNQLRSKLGDNLPPNAVQETKMKVDRLTTQQIMAWGQNQAVLAQQRAMAQAGRGGGNMMMAGANMPGQGRGM